MSARSSFDSFSSTETFLSNAASDRNFTGTGCSNSSPRSFATASAIGLMRESHSSVAAPAGAATTAAALTLRINATTHDGDTPPEIGRPDHGPVNHPLTS